MPAPRQMRYAEDGNGTVSVEERVAEVKALIAQLRNGTDEEKSQAALGVYNMTSFASAVSIDDPKALTSYDRKVFGHSHAEGTVGDTKMGEADTASQTSQPRPESTDHELGEAEHVDGKRYMMGDGFMLMEEQNGGKEARRVAVMHSRKCLDNRVLIGSVEGIFEALVDALKRGSSETRWQVCRATSQVLFRNTDNKVRMGALPDALEAIGMVMDESLAAKDARCLAEACRAMGVLVSGVRPNQQAVANLPRIVAALHRVMQEGEGEAPGQAGKVLNSVSHLLPEPA